MNKKCRHCKVSVSLKNCSPSFLKTHANPLCRTCQAAYRRDAYKKLRRKVINELGDKCQECGQVEYQLLTIDHIHGGGHQENKKTRGRQYLQRILDMEDPKSKYRILCYCCNYTLGFWGVNAYDFER